MKARLERALADSEHARRRARRQAFHVAKERGFPKGRRKPAKGLLHGGTRLAPLQTKSGIRPPVDRLLASSFEPSFERLRRSAPPAPAPNAGVSRHRVGPGAEGGLPAVVFEGPDQGSQDVLRDLFRVLPIPAEVHPETERGTGNEGEEEAEGFRIPGAGGPDHPGFDASVA